MNEIQYNEVSCPNNQINIKIQLNETKTTTGNLYLEETDYINYNDPIIQIQIQEIFLNYDKSLLSRIQIIKIIHDYIRDEIKYGFTYHLHNRKASDVLIDKVGNAHTKTTLFVAMLRALDIPCRIVFANISTELFRGFGVLGQFMDHSYVEISIENKWIKMDSYVIDSELYMKSKSQLEQEIFEYDNKLTLASRKYLYGYGIHLHGNIEFNIQYNTMIQLVSDEFSSREWGHYRDVMDFYDSAIGTQNNYDDIFPINLITKAYISYLNYCIHNLRNKNI